MPRYVVRLHEGPDTPPIVEDVDAADDGDALDLAQMRLLLTREYTRVLIYRDDAKVAEMRRDSLSH